MFSFMKRWSSRVSIFFFSYRDALCSARCCTLRCLLRLRCIINKPALYHLLCLRCVACLVCAITPCYLACLRRFFGMWVHFCEKRQNDGTPVSHQSKSNAVSCMAVVTVVASVAASAGSGSGSGSRPLRRCS